MDEQVTQAQNTAGMACTELPLPDSTKGAAHSGFRGEIRPPAAAVSSQLSATAALEALTARLSLDQHGSSDVFTGGAGTAGTWGFLSGIPGLPEKLQKESRSSDADQRNSGLRQSSAEALQGRSSEDNDEEAQDGEAGPEDESDERYARMRQKNRRAQQRFRQRQKAKLQAKEIETFQLQKQVQDMQTQMASIQLQGVSPDVRMQMARLQAQNQALQIENAELRLLATDLLEKNATLQAVQGSHSLAASSLTPHASSSPASGSAPAFPHFLQPASFPASISRPVIQQRAAVFMDVRRVPWQRAGTPLESGLPVGLSPGSSGMAVLVKVLNKAENGSSTVLAQFPPGFIHDYVIGTDVQSEEAFILAGSLTDLAFNQTFYPGEYAHVLPGTCHGPYRADTAEGCLVLCLTRSSAT